MEIVSDFDTYLGKKPEMIEIKLPKCKISVEKNLWDNVTFTNKSYTLKLKNNIVANITPLSTNSLVAVTRDEYGFKEGFETVFSIENSNVEISTLNNKKDDIRFDFPQNSNINITKDKSDIVYPRLIDTNSAVHIQSQQ